MKNALKKAVDKIKIQIEENPLLVIAVAGFAVTATAKLINATVNANNSKTWSKEVKRRDRMTR